MRACERLLTYVAFGTTSSETSGTTPSTASQYLLAKHLEEELHCLGIEDVTLTEQSYLYASIPATPGYEKSPAIGFIAHIDTAPDYCGEHVSPCIVEPYEGKDLVLGSSGKVLSAKQFPHLRSLIGKSLITTDGTTLLGADDKAGIAEIMTMVETIQLSGCPHGKICIGFTPDEEIGEGADHFDVEKFGAQFAYTVDGGEEGSIEYENFNAAEAFVQFHGFNIHPGDAKNKMINASLLAVEYNEKLPKGQTPRDTEGYEGFFHMLSMNGDIEKASLRYIIRDHSTEQFCKRKETMFQIAEQMNLIYGNGTVEVEVKDQYYNMATVISDHMELIEGAKAATKRSGIEPSVEPIRGGTDGARLSFMGLPCPNLGTGGHSFHGPYEHIAKESMDAVVKILVALTEYFARNK